MVLRVDARFLVRAVPHAKAHALVIPFRDRHARRHVRGLLIHVPRLDSRELKKLHAVQPALRVLHEAALIQVAGLVGQLAANHAIAHAFVAGDLDRAKVRQRARLRRKRQRRRLPSRPIVFARGDLCVRKAMIAQLVERHFMRRDDELPIARQADRQRRLSLERGEVRRRDDIEAAEHDRRDLDWIAFRDRDADVGRVLLRIELHIEAGHPRVGISTVGVESLDALEVRVEARSVEVILLPPRQDRALVGGEGVFQPRLIDGLHAAE